MHRRAIPALRLRRLLLVGGVTSALLGAAGPHPTPAAIESELVDLPGGTEGWLLRVDLKRARLRVLDAQDYGQKSLTAAEFQRRSGAVAVWNGPFFDENGKPLGLLIEDGRKRNPLRNVDWGVFYEDSTGAHIVHTKEWKEPQGVLQAIQVGPRLVVDRVPVSLKPQSARRTAMCLQDAEHLLVLVTDAELQASDLASLFVAHRCQDALNLDGGPSTQLVARLPGRTIDLRGGWPVPVAIGIFAEGGPTPATDSGCACSAPPRADPSASR